MRCELKKDKRTIEETLADIRAKKQLKLNHPPPETTSGHTPANAISSVNPTNARVGNTNSIPSQSVNRCNTITSTNTNISRVSVRDVISSNSVSLGTTADDGADLSNTASSDLSHGKRGGISPPAV